MNSKHDWLKGLTTKARTTHFFEPNARGAKSCPIAHRIRLSAPSASLSFIGACCVVNGSVRVRRMLDPNLGRTCRIEALGNTWIFSFSSDCLVNWTQVAPSWSSAEAFSDLLKLFRRGTDGVYLFTTPMQAMASHASGYLAREWIPARSARAFREHASDLRRFFFLFLFLKIRVYKRNNEELIGPSLFLFFVDPLLDWNPNSCGDDGSTHNLDNFFYFFGECCLKKVSLVQMCNIFRL